MAGRGSKLCGEGGCVCEGESFWAAEPALAAGADGIHPLEAAFRTGLALATLLTAWARAEGPRGARAGAAARAVARLAEA